jgi:nucleoside-diphosphate-sugar epimerase
MSPERHALILGGTGMVGANMGRLLDRVGGWEVTLVSRREPDFATRARHVACDMGDADACARVLGSMADATDVFWTGHATGTQWIGKAASDTDLFRNAMTALEPAARDLRHICLLQGSKYCGRHLGPFRTPAREDDPRHFPPNLYYTQEDSCASCSGASVGASR